MEQLNMSFTVSQTFLSMLQVECLTRDFRLQRRSISPPYRQLPTSTNEINGRSHVYLTFLRDHHPNPVCDGPSKHSVVTKASKKC